VRRLNFGYNTNGFAHHSLEDALSILSKLGYDCVALTLDHHTLQPGHSTTRRQLPVIRSLLQQFRCRPAIETGARFLLDPLRKHQPTLISPSKLDRQKRLHFLKQSIDIAARLNAEVVSLWSGTPVDQAGNAVWMRRLRTGCFWLADYAAKRNVRLAFEPEPGMFIDTMDKFSDLFERVAHPHFGLTIDIGHLHCQGEPIESTLRAWKDRLWNVHIEDMRRSVHDHLFFGDGEIAFPPVLRTLREIGYVGGAHVELSRHSHNAVETARRALAFLRTASS
jgi:sugar phosphate isomerase/epimerase